MSGDKKANTHSHAKRRGLWKIFDNGVRTKQDPPPRRTLQCAACLQITEYSDDHLSCSYCGASLSALVAISGYSNKVSDLVPISHEVYYLTPPKRTVDQRRHGRIVCKHVRACIRTEQGAEVLVDLINMGRGGICFSSDTDFHLNTLVLVATHYFEGGQNIFQKGRIIRVQRKPTALIPGEFAIEFSFGSGV